MYICICSGITDTQIKNEVKAGATTLAHLQERLGVAAGCGSCKKLVSTYLPSSCTSESANIINLLDEKRTHKTISQPQEER